jgi:uncharacterized protein (DUF2147 family)
MTASRWLAAVLGLALAGWAACAAAVDFDAMVGKWSWEGFVIKVTKSGPHGISAKVVEGPKNVGMEMIRSKPELRADFFIAQVKNPANGKVYHTKISQKGADSWRLDGCTAGGACATGVFKRVE